MWKYKNKKFDKIEDFPEGAFGFIYVIRNLSNGRAYIGKKNLYFEKKVALTKKEIAALPSKRYKKYKQVVKESDWLKYNSSCKPLLADIQAGHEIEKEILQIAMSKRQLTYLETKYLFTCEVLETEDFYNENIEYRYYKGNIE